MSKVKHIVLWTVLAWSLCIWAGATGTVLTPVLVGEDLENGYVFALEGLGEFSANITSGESASVAMISLDEGLYATVHRDGTEISFGEGLFFDAGSYQVRIYSTTGAIEDYGLFTFTIASDYFGSLSSINGEITWERYPELAVSYNQDTKQFIYTMEPGVWFGCTVPLGGRYNGVAQVSVAENVTVLATYLDGVLITTPEDLVFNQRGEYALSLVYNFYGLSGDTAYSTTLNFTLGADTITTQTLVPSPYGLALTAITLDGTALPVVSPDYAYLTQDGIYKLTYSGDGFGYERSFLRDSTPPYITFSEPMDGSVITKDLSFTLSDPTATITVTRNRMAVVLQEYVIAQDGDYVITIADGHDNTRTYAFTIQHTNDNWVGLLWFVPLAGGAVAIVLLCRRLSWFIHVR